MRKAFIVLLALIVASVVAFAYRMGRHDMQALRDFETAYEHFDRAITALGAQRNPSSTEQAAAALADFQKKAAMRISSLTKNDGSMMMAAREVAAMATQELTAVNAYQAVAVTDADSARILATEAANVRNERISRHARFQYLATAPPNSAY